MNKNKIKILFLGIIVLIGGLGFYQSAAAADASVYVLPATLSKNVGETFNISAGVNPGGNKVCAVEGKLNLNKLSCQSIAVADGVMAQSSPSCNNLYFLIGIPGCTTGNKTLFTVNVKAGSAGIATANFTGVDVIGEGISVSFNSLGGSYTLIAPAVKEETTPPPAEEGVSEEEITPKEAAPSEEITPEKAGPEGVVQPETAAPAPTTGFLAAIGAMPFNLKIILIIVGIIALGLIVLWLIKKRKKI